MNKMNCVLLIDDDPINNFLNKRLLTKLNIANEVNVVLNGAQGLAFIEEHCKKTENCPEMILLDINMPVMNGFGFLKAMKSLV